MKCKFKILMYDFSDEKLSLDFNKRWLRYYQQRYHELVLF